MSGKEKAEMGLPRSLRHSALLYCSGLASPSFGLFLSKPKSPGPFEVCDHVALFRQKGHLPRCWGCISRKHSSVNVAACLTGIWGTGEGEVSNLVVIG